jgi:hypothetical protein
MNKRKWIHGLLSLLICQKAALADTAMEGVRAALQAGYGIIDTKVNFARTLAPLANDTSDVSGRGVIGGFLLDWQATLGHSDILMGAEGSFNWSTCKGKKSTVGTFILSGATDDLSTTVLFKRAFEVMFKVGYLAKGAALGYVKAGPSLSHWKASSVSLAAQAGGSVGQNLTGYALGIGAEFPLGDSSEGRLTWGGEYIYRSYKSFAHQLLDNTGNSIRTISITPSAHAIMLRLNYKVSATDFTTSPPPKERKRKRFKKPKPDES